MSTPASKKELIVQDIQNNFQTAKAVIFYNFHHAEERDILQLKKELRKIGGQWKVYKNNLVKKALTDYPLQLQQANAFVFCQEDEYKPLSLLAKFNQNHTNLQRFQGGIYEQKLIDSLLIEKWSKLPSKEILMSTLCYYLNWQVRRLVNILENLQKIKN